MVAVGFIHCGDEIPTETSKEKRENSLNLTCCVESIEKNKNINLLSDIER